MSINNDFGDITFDMPKHKSNVIKVIGVGGGGSNAINYMFKQGIKGVDFVICNTDAQALKNSGVPNKIQLGVNLTEGLGAGANPEVGEQAAVESLEDIRRMLETNTKMVFITAGMGGGTGTGAAPIIAKMAKELDILTVGIVTMPFQFEGKMRNQQAQKGIQKLREHVDSLIVINNNKLREVYGNLGFKAGFSKADEVLATASRGIAEVITHHYTQNIDLRDAKTVLSNSGTAIMGSAVASGQTRAQDAIMKALDSPLLNDNKITGAKNVLLLIVSGVQEITIDEIGEISDHIQNEAGHGADIIMGVGEDDTLEESISVTIIATGFDIDQQNEISNTEAKKVIHSLEESEYQGEKILSDNLKPNKPSTTNIEEQPIIHNLVEDTHIDDTILEKTHSELIPTTETIKNIPVIYDKVEDLIEDENFVITPIESKPNTEIIEQSAVSDEDQITLSFDLPITKKEASTSLHEQGNDIEPTIFNIDEDLKDIIVNEPAEFIAVTEVNEQGEKRYVLEDHNDDCDDKISSPQQEELVENEEIVLEKKIVEQDTSETDVESEDMDPLNTPISELLKSRANERRKHMKDFNYKFNNAKIDEIEKEPAYKRSGVDLQESKHSSETNVSRLSVSTDDNDDTQLRTNNSFLHDNVD